MSILIQDIIDENLQKLKQEIIDRHVAAGQVASGKTKDSFQVDTQELSGQLLGPQWAGVLERGRKPGKVPANFRDILIRWAAAKGITFQSESQAKSWAYFVSKKIRAEGTELYRSGATVDIFTTAVDEMEKSLTEEISQMFQQEIIKNIFY